MLGAKRGYEPCPQQHENKGIFSLRFCAVARFVARNRDATLPMLEQRHD